MSIPRDRIAVLVPVYNEAKYLGPFLEALKAQRLAVLVVDDGSTDGSAAIARKMGVDALMMERNFGKGHVLRTGFKRLVDAGYDWVIIMDGDGQHLASEIPGFIRAAEESGPRAVVNGDRLRDPKGMPPVRLWTNLLMSWVVGAFSGQRVTDSQCGYKMLPASFLKEARLTSEHFEIEAELLLEAVRLKYRVAFAPVTTIYAGEASHIRPFLDTLRFFWFLIKWSVRLCGRGRS